jgi:hypothetical protein
MYAEPTSNGFILRKRAGLELAVDLDGNNAVRGTYTTSTDRMFAVRGNSIYEISTANIATLRGSLNSVIGMVSFADNGVNMAIADGSALKNYNLDTNVITTVTDVDAPTNTPQIFVIDGFFIGFDPDVVEIGTYRWSAVDNLDSWPSANYNNASKVPDKLVGIVANGGDLWLLGSKSYEIHYNTGILENEFQLVNGSAFEIGCGAMQSIAKHANSVYWLGADKEGHGSVYRSVGYQVQQISTFKENARISEINDFSDAIGMVYQIGGHSFYKLTFQSGDLTLVYNITTGLWSEETWWNDITMLQERSRAVCHNFFNNKNYIGDSRNGKIYFLENNVYEDDGNPIICEVQFPHYNSMRQPLFFHSLEVVCDMGVGTNVLDPQIQISYSDDGGYNFSNWRNFSLGKAGQFLKRVLFTRLGMSKYGERVFKLRHSQNSTFNVMNQVIAEIESGV